MLIQALYSGVDDIYFAAVQYIKKVNLLAQLSRHMSDFLVYFLVPMVAVLMPAAFSRSMIAQMSGWQWLLAEEAKENCIRAAKYTAIDDEREWLSRWRLVTILEARDLSLMLWGRRNAVFREIEGAADIVQARDRVLIGMHWGPSIAILSLLHSRGQKPLLVYRPVERSIIRHRPWFYFFLTRSVRYIRKTCGKRAITIKGAGAELKRELPLPGTSVVVLDAPPTPGRSTIDGTVLGRDVKFNAGFPGILDESGREYLFYAISLKQGNTTLRTLELTTRKRPVSQDQLIDDYCRFMTAHIQPDSAQWRIWGVADQFFQPISETAAGEQIEG